MVQQDELRQDSGVTIVTERRHYTVAIGVMVVILAVAAVVADANPYSTAKRVVVAAIFGVFIALCVLIWIGVNRHRNRIEVSADAVRYVHWSGRTAVEWRREEVPELRLVRRLSDRKLFLYDRLVVPGTDAWLNLKWFSSRAVRQACLERRWPIEPAS